jgi:hypothetical protein
MKVSILHRIFSRVLLITRTLLPKISASSYSNSLSNVKVHTPLPASDNSETEGQP